MVQVSAKITLEEFLQLPETKPASEYINGQIIQKPMPQGKHSKLQGKLVTAINEVAESKQSVLVYPANQQTKLLTQFDVLSVPDLVSNLRLKVADLFSWLKLGKSRD